MGAKYKPSDDFDAMAAMYEEKYFDFSTVHAINSIYMDAPLEAPEEYLEMRGALAPVAIHVDMMKQLALEDPTAYKAAAAAEPMMIANVEPRMPMDRMPMDMGFAFRG